MQLSYKVPNGKMLNVDIEIEQNKIKEIKLTGDFFIFPNEAIKDIENFLKDTPINQINKNLSNFLKENSIEIIGFSPQDIENLIIKNYDY